MGFAESDPTAQSWVGAFQNALAKLGWTEGSNLRIELRWAAADPDKIRSFARELVDLRPSRCRSAEKRNEFPPPHSITSSAVASRFNGNMRLVEESGVRKLQTHDLGDQCHAQVKPAA
jgi:hypothetical protein